MCERQQPDQPTYELRDLLVLLDDVGHRLAQARPSAQTDEVIASVQQHRQMVARWLAHPPSRTVQANAAATILSVIAGANAAAHAAHFDTGSWRPVQAELRAAQHSHPEANVPLFFDLTWELGRGIALAVLNDELVPAPLPWLPKAGTKRVCEVRVDGIDEPLVLIAECVGIETPDGVLLSLVAASRRQHARIEALAAGEHVADRSRSRDELPTLTEDEVLASSRRNMAAHRALGSNHPALSGAEPRVDDEITSQVHIEDASVTGVVFDEPVFTPPFLTETEPASSPAPISAVEALLEQYCHDLEEHTAETRISYEPLPTQPPDDVWRTPITLPPPSGLAEVARAPRAAANRVKQPLFSGTDLAKTQPPPPMLLETQPPPPMPEARPLAKTQELPDLLFANAPVGHFAHHSDVANIVAVACDEAEQRQTPVPTVVSLDEEPARTRSRRRRGGALLLAASIALGLFASPSPNPSSPDVARTFTPAMTPIAITATALPTVTEMVTVERKLVRKLRD